MDDLGNRLSTTLRDGSGDTYAVDALTNRYDSIDSVGLDYDAAGNLTQDKDGYVYGYDYENRIVEIRNSADAVIAQMDYDTQGRRIRVHDAAAGTETLYYYSDQWQVLAEYAPSGTQQAYYVYGNYIDEVLLMHRSSADKYYLHDHLYSAVALLNSAGSVIERYEYDAYGKATVWNSDFSNTYAYSQFGNPYAFTGRELNVLDGGNLLRMQYRHRDYCAYMGRYFIQDTRGLVPASRLLNYFKAKRQYVDGLSRYNYVRSNPSIAVDPFGLTLIIIPPSDIENPPITPPIHFPIVPPTGGGSQNGSKNECQRCGPDVTVPLVSLLRDVVANFNQYTLTEKLSGCISMYHPLAGWDIPTLWDVNYDGHSDSNRNHNRMHPLASGGYDQWVPAFASFYKCPTKSSDPKKNCYGSLTVGGKCYKASSINYALFGTQKRLCSKFLNGFDPDNALSESEYYKSMIDSIYVWKHYRHEEDLDQMSEALGWASAGWFSLDEGANLTSLLPESKHFSHCETDCPSCEGFADWYYQWLGTRNSEYPRY